mgnify:FL=1
MTVTGSLLIALLALVFDFILGMIEKHSKRHSKAKGKSFRKKPAAIICGVLAALILLASLYLHSGHSRTIHIATKPMTEQYILGEMLGS